MKTISERLIGTLIFFFRKREEYQIAYQCIFGLSKLENFLIVAKKIVVQLVFKVRGKKSSKFSKCKLNNFSSIRVNDEKVQIWRHSLVWDIFGVSNGWWPGQYQELQDIAKARI